MAVSCDLQIYVIGAKLPVLSFFYGEPTQQLHVI